MLGEGTSPLHSRGSGGVSSPSPREIDLIFAESKYQYSDTVNVADMLGEGTSPLHSRGSGGVSPPSPGEIDLIFIVSKY